MLGVSKGPNGAQAQSPGLARGTSAYPGELTNSYPNPAGVEAARLRAVLVPYVSFVAGLQAVPGSSPRLPRRGYLGYKETIRNPNWGCGRPAVGPKRCSTRPGLTKELLNHAAIVICSLPAFALLHQRTSPASARQTATRDTYGIGRRSSLKRSEGFDQF